VPRTHVVRAGDTLWALADRYLNDPYGWERIWRQNRERLSDPHLLPIGLELAIPIPAARGETGAGEAARGRRTAGAPGPGRRTAGARTAQERAAAFAGPSIFDRNPGTTIRLSRLELDRNRSPILVSPSDIYRAGLLVPRRSSGPRARTARIVEENVLDLDLPPSVGRRGEVMLWLDGLPVRRGDRLQAVREGRGVGGGMRIMESVALLEVLRVEGDSARARVLEIFGRYTEGDPVLPAPSLPPDGIRRLRETSRPVRARIVAVEVDQVLPSVDDRVFLDVGRASGVGVGDEFAVLSSTAAATEGVAGREVVAIARVVRVRDGTSTARIVDLRDVGLRAGAVAVRVREPVPPGE